MDEKYRFIGKKDGESVSKREALENSLQEIQNELKLVQDSLKETDDFIKNLADRHALQVEARNIYRARYIQLKANFEKVQEELSLEDAANSDATLSEASNKTNN